MSKKRMLITGGSGFLGGVMALRLREQFDVQLTYASQPVQIEGCRSCRMDFHDEESVKTCLHEFQPDVIVHTAAISTPAICEKNPELCQQVNVEGTRMLIDHLPSAETLFIFTSSDLIFDGTKPPYKEDDPMAPVSAYGRSKRDSERMIQERCSRYAILRPALIYGPAAPSGKSSFIQWIDGTLKKGEKVKLFTDEYRTPVYAEDITEAVLRIVEKGIPNRVYNLGGPLRTDRFSIGKALAELQGYDPTLLEPVSLKNLDTGYPRPADLTLNCFLIQQELEMKLTPVDEALKEIFKK